MLTGLVKTNMLQVHENVWSHSIFPALREENHTTLSNLTQASRGPYLLYTWLSVLEKNRRPCKAGLDQGNEETF